MKRVPPLLGMLACLLAATSFSRAEGQGVTLDIQNLIDTAIREKQPVVKIPPGVHRLEKSGKHPSYHLFFRGAENLTIDGTGATLVFTDSLQGGVAFHDSKNLIIRGLTFDYDPLPYTQGGIVALDPQGTWIDVELHAGYRSDPEYFTGGRLAGYVHDAATRTLKRGTYDLYIDKMTIERPGVARFHFSRPDANRMHNVAAGDLLMVSRRAGGGVRLINCENSAVDGVTVFAAPGIAIQEANGVGNNRYTYTVTRGPTPAGATEPRLHSANADAFHSAFVHKGPVVENCLFEYMGDDGVAIHGTFSLLTGVDAPDTIVVSPKFDLNYQVGDALRIIDGTIHSLKDQARITAIEKVAAPTGEELAKVTGLWEKYRTDIKGRSFYRLQLDKPVNAAFGDLTGSYDRSGSGFVVRNNISRHHRARGIFIKSGDGVVEGNTLEDISMPAIGLGPELGTWLGGEYARNVVIRNNTIKGSGHGANGYRSSTSIQGAAITIQAAQPDQKMAQGHENKNIVIEANTIEDSAGPAMIITSAENVVVKGNVVRTPRMASDMRTGKAYGIDLEAAIYLDEARNVTVEGNQIDLTGGNATKPLATGDRVDNLSSDLRTPAR